MLYLFTNDVNLYQVKMPMFYKVQTTIWPLLEEKMYNK